MTEIEELLEVNSSVRKLALREAERRMQVELELKRVKSELELERLNKKLNLYRKINELYGITPAGIFEYSKDHWIGAILLFVAGVFFSSVISKATFVIISKLFN